MNKTACYFYPKYLCYCNFIFLVIYSASPAQFSQFLPCPVAYILFNKAGITVLNYFRLQVACSMERPMQAQRWNAFGTAV